MDVSDRTIEKFVVKGEINCASFVELRKDQCCIA